MADSQKIENGAGHIHGPGVSNPLSADLILQRRRVLIYIRN
jgi:hypothetical protein